MYEETGRLRRQLISSVLDGVYAQEDDPISLRVRVRRFGERVKLPIGSGVHRYKIPSRKSFACHFCSVDSKNYQLVLLSRRRR